MCSHPWSDLAGTLKVVAQAIVKAPPPCLSGAHKTGRKEKGGGGWGGGRVGGVPGKGTMSDGGSFCDVNRLHGEEKNRGVAVETNKKKKVHSGRHGGTRQTIRADACMQRWMSERAGMREQVTGTDDSATTLKGQECLSVCDR